MPYHLITDHGARPDRADNASAIQAAIDACHADGGGRVVVPASREPFITGSLRLRSHVELHLEAGATLAGSSVPEHYQRDTAAGEYADVTASAFLLRADDAAGVAVTGLGTIDGRGSAFMAGYREGAEPYIYKWGPFRPKMIGLTGCRGVTFRDVTLRDAAHWCLHMTGCDDVNIDGVRIFNGTAIPNCDGIDPDACTNVRISNCHIEAGDDCIVMKVTRAAVERGYTRCVNILINNCTLMSTSAAVKIGTESHGDFRDICVSNCTIRGSNRGVAIQLRDHGNVENVLFSHLVIETRLFHEAWWGRGEPIYITAFPRHEGGAVGVVRNVRVSDVVCRGESGVFIAGDRDMQAADRYHICDVALDGVDVHIRRTSKWRGGWHDRRPIRGGEFIGLSEHPTSGVHIEGASGVLLGGVRVTWGGDGGDRPDYFSHALHARDSPGLNAAGLTGDAAHPERDEAVRVEGC